MVHFVISKKKLYIRVLVFFHDPAADLALENVAMDLRRARGDPTQVRKGDVSRRLEFCLDGFWLITPRGGGFPFYGVSKQSEQF